MNAFLWTLQAVLAAVFTGTGSFKLLKSKAEVIEKLGDAVEGFPAARVKLLGLAEVLGAVGLLLPPMAGLWTVLTPIAAVGLAVVMVGATVVHARRGRRTHVFTTVVLGLMAVVVAWARFGPYAF